MSRRRWAVGAWLLLFGPTAGCYATTTNTAYAIPESPVDREARLERYERGAAVWFGETHACPTDKVDAVYVTDDGKPRPRPLPDADDASRLSRTIRAEGCKARALYECTSVSRSVRINGRDHDVVCEEQPAR
jgi:hypothetical protein